MTCKNVLKTGYRVEFGFGTQRSPGQLWDNRAGFVKFHAVMCWEEVGRSFLFLSLEMKDETQKYYAKCVEMMPGAKPY